MIPSSTSRSVPGLLLALACTASAAGALPAFPGAEGFGSQTPGGRGGRVIAVTTLDDAGPGSFREAVTTPGPRIVVFRVGGEIRLQSHLRITEPFVTIAGETAPGGGILLRDAGLYVNTHDVIIRFLRSRLGPSLNEEFDTQDTLQISGDDTYSVVVDHCSFSWSIDEGVGIRTPAHDVTFSWNIVSESLRTPFTREQIGKDRSHSMALILSGGPTRTTLHHNLLAHCNSRNPRIQGGLHDFVNNVVYDWGFLSGTFSRDPEVNFIGNTYRRGPASRNILAICEEADGMGRIFTLGNRSPQRPTDSLPEWETIVAAPEAAHRTMQPFPTPVVTTSDADTACEQVLRFAGATLPGRDEVDLRIIRDTRLRMGGKIDRPNEVGGYPTIEPGDAPSDRDGDGMPDDWELAMGFDADDPADGSGDADHDGYTNVEEYFQHLIREGTRLRPEVYYLTYNEESAPITVAAGDADLPVVRAKGDMGPDVYYTHSWFRDPVDLTITLPEGTAFAGGVVPPRYADGAVAVDDRHMKLTITEEGPRLIPLSVNGVSAWLLIHLVPWRKDAPNTEQNNVVNASDYGLVTGMKDVTEPIQKALDAAAADPARNLVFVTNGDYRVTTLRIPSGVELYLSRGTRIFAEYDYERRHLPVIYFDGVENASVSGPGMIEGHVSGKPLIAVSSSRHIGISELTLRGHQYQSLTIRDSEHVRIERIRKLSNFEEHDGGLQVLNSCNVSVWRSFLSGAGGVAIQGHSVSKASQPLTQDVSLREVVVLSSAESIGIGDLVSDVLVQDCDVIGPLQGVLIAGRQIQRIVFRDTTLRLTNPAKDHYDCGWPIRIRGTDIQDVLFDRVQANASAGCILRGHEPGDLRDIKLWGVRLDTRDAARGSGQPAQPLIAASNIDGLQLRFLYVRKPASGPSPFSKLLITDHVENLKQPEGETFELTGDEPEPLAN